jgi:hypothetical protein
MSMQSLVVRREVTQPNSGLKVVFWEWHLPSWDMRMADSWSC